MRRLVREHELAAADLIQPLFVVHGSRVEREIGSMPGVFHLSVDESLDREVDRIQALGIPAVHPVRPARGEGRGRHRRTSPRTASSSGRCGGCGQRHPDLLLITDVCCCEYTSHGHCGVLRDGAVDNDATLEILGRVAVSHARGRRRHRGAERDDGRHGRARSARALDGAGHHRARPS